MSNHSFKSQMNPLSVALMIVIAAIVGYQAAAFRPEPQPTIPQFFATFDLERAFNNIDEKTAADAELQRMADEMKKQTDAEGKSLQQMEKDLEDLAAGSAKHREMMEALMLRTGEYQADVEFYRVKLDIERSRTMKNLYLNIRKAAEQIAAERGYKIVFVDDSIAPIPAGTSEDMTRQISARRMVFTSPEVDITDVLIKRLNDSFKTAGPAQQ